MFRLFIAFVFFALTACDSEDKEASRKVVSLTSPSGQAFHFMPIYEDGVTDITLRIAWPSNWGRTEGLNPAVPYVGADLILSGGTEALKPQDILEKFEDNNAYGFLNASPDYVFGELGFPKEHIDETVEIAAEMLANPQLNEQWMDRIKGGFVSNVTKARSQSSSAMWSAARQVVLGPTQLFKSTDLLVADDIMAITQEDIQNWHAETFTKTGMTIVITGAIQPEKAGEIVDTVIAKLPEGRPVDVITDAADFSPVTILIHRPEAEKTTIGLMGQLPPTSEGDGPEDLLASRILSGANGPLFNAIRTELRATYGLKAGYMNFTRAIRPMIVFGEVETNQLAEARDVILQTYEEFRLDPDLRGLNEMRDDLAAKTEENVGYVDVAAQVMMEKLLDGLDPLEVPTLHKTYDAVTADVMKARLKDHFPPADQLIVIAVSPDETALPGACIITDINAAFDCR